jgi:hypothetical protein
MTLTFLEACAWHGSIRQEVAAKSLDQTVGVWGKVYRRSDLA